jgi:hypothetical protein
MNGLLMNGDKAVYATSSPVNYSNGIQRTASGAIYCVDATAGLPAGATWTNGLPFSVLGALCIANNAVVTWSNGIPFDANGAVCAAFLPDIASLFANGEEGWWYDPSNFATLFQDSAGTTPVTAMEQPVGLQLDLSKGLVLGPELFSSSVGLGATARNARSVLGTVTATSATVSSNASGTFGINFPALTPSIGKTYAISLSYASSPSKAVTLNFGGLNFTSSSSTITGYFVATTSTSLLDFFVNAAASGEQFTISSISVKELPGNHRFQTTSANRPVVSARVNLLTKTEQLTDSAWVKTAGVTVTDNAAVAPDGTTTATNIAFGATNREIAQSFATTNGGTTPTFYVKGTAGQVLNFGAGGQDRSITLTGGWDLASSTLPAGIAKLYIGNYTVGANALNISVWHPDIRSSTQGVGLPVYQRVNTSTDYDSTGFPVYIKPNGSNQFMVTNSINFTATDKMTVWQGVRKLSDAAAATVIGVNGVSGTNSFTFRAPQSNVANYAFYSAGSVAFGGSAVSPSSYAAPITNVATGIGDISGDVATLRINGVQAVTVSGDQGTGNYGNFPAYFYAREGSSLHFNGHDYGSIARGAASTAAQIAAGEEWINSKTKAY